MVLSFFWSSFPSSRSTKSTKSTRSTRCRLTSQKAQPREREVERAQPRKREVERVQPHRIERAQPRKRDRAQPRKKRGRSGASRRGARELRRAQRRELSRAQRRKSQRRKKRGYRQKAEGQLLIRLLMPFITFESNVRTARLGATLLPLSRPPLRSSGCSKKQLSSPPEWCCPQRWWKGCLGTKP